MSAKKTRRTVRKRSPQPLDVPPGYKRASLFMNGRTQSVRLPKEFRFEGTHVLARKEGDRVILSPADDRMERFLAAFGSAPDFPDVSRDDAQPVRREIAEYFDVPDR